MPLEKIKDFTVSKLSILDPAGKVDSKLMPPLSEKQLLELYEWMVLLRAFDDKCLKLQRQGRIGTYASSRGQEACTIGSAYVLQKQDWTFPAFREHGVFMVRGTPLVKIIQYWGGDERGSKSAGGLNCFPVSIPVGSQPLHAVGAAMGIQIKKKDAVSVGYFGDGATSEGDTLEAMNFAGVFQPPVVLICQNNQFAISEPRSLQTHSETIAQKAIGFGFEGLQVDGNDVIAVYKATLDAVAKARAGKGPTLLELYTYRMGDHTTADDSTRYRSKEELEEWRAKDPIERLRLYLNAQGILTPQKEEQIMTEATQKVESAVTEYEKMPPAPVNDMFDFLQKDISPDLAAQKNDFLAFLSKQEKKTPVENTSEKNVPISQAEGPGFP